MLQCLATPSLQAATYAVHDLCHPNLMVGKIPLAVCRELRALKASTTLKPGRRNSGA
jgi:hypothetical protein